MGFERNQSVWGHHYTQDRSRQDFPDENIVRYIQRYLRNNGENRAKPTILDLGSGSGRNLKYIRSVCKNTVGSDFSIEALRGQDSVVCSMADDIPFHNNSFDLIIAWGLLHYLPKKQMHNCILEMKRILKPGGRIFGTLRSDQDTHLQNVLEKGDLSGANANIYSKDELIELFPDFAHVNTGHISRQPIGEDSTIAHHMFEAVL